MPTRDPSDQLREAIAGLKALLARHASVEQDFQTWFEENPVVFRVLGYRSWVAQPRLSLPGQRLLEPDFLVEDFNGVWSVLELKRHDTMVLKSGDRRVDFRSEFSSYLQQCREYAVYFLDAANRRFTENKYGIRIQPDVLSVIVASTDEVTDRSVAHHLFVDRGNKVELRTYSEILRALLRHLDFLFESSAGLRGLTAVLLGVLPLDKPRQILLDVGSSRRSRCSLGLAGTRVLCSLVDANGHQRRWDVERPLVVDFAHASPLSLVELEIGVSSSDLHIAVHYNRRCIMEIKQPAAQVVVEDLSGGMAIGTDIDGVLPSCFEAAELILYRRTLAPSERLEIYAYLDEVYRYYLSPLAVHRPVAVSFRGNKWLATAGHPLSAEKRKPLVDARGPWAWYNSRAIVLGDGTRAPDDPRLGVPATTLPGMAAKGTG